MFAILAINPMLLHNKVDVVDYINKLFCVLCLHETRPSLLATELLKPTALLSGFPSQTIAVGVGSAYYYSGQLRDFAPSPPHRQTQIYKTQL